MDLSHLAQLVAHAVHQRLLEDAEVAAVEAAHAEVLGAHALEELGDGALVVDRQGLHGRAHHQHEAARVRAERHVELQLLVTLKTTSY